MASGSVHEAGAEKSRREGRQPCDVLVADDDMPGLLLAEEAIRLYACTVVSVSGGLDALVALEKRPFDVVFLDVHMPDLDGLATTQRIRALELRLNRTRTPVIALTASAMPSEQAACLQSGMDDILLKPFLLEGLWKMLQKWCP